MYVLSPHLLRAIAPDIYENFADMLDVGDPTVGRFLRQFIYSTWLWAAELDGTRQRA